MTITERIFYVLSEKGLSQKEFAQSIGVNEKTVSAWKKNNSLPPADKLSEISDYLNISVNYLLSGEETSNFIDVHSSNVGAVGNNINGTVNIGNNNLTYDNNSVASSNDEMADELLKIFKALPLRERTKIMTKVYEIEDEYIKSK